MRGRRGMSGLCVTSVFSEASCWMLSGLQRSVKRCTAHPQISGYKCLYRAHAWTFFLCWTHVPKYQDWMWRQSLVDQQEQEYSKNLKCRGCINSAAAEQVELGSVKVEVVLWTYVECWCVTHVSDCSCTLLQRHLPLQQILSGDFWGKFCPSNGLEVQMFSDYKWVSGVWKYLSTIR